MKAFPAQERVWLFSVAKEAALGYHRTMSVRAFPINLVASRFHLVGIKGTGMSALAELLHEAGARVSGSDVADEFYTDAILSRLGIPYTVGFDAADLPANIDVVIHSAAYTPDLNPQLRAAASRGLPLFRYTQALGALSTQYDSIGIAGVHGKTTTTALIGILCQALAVPAKIVVGGAVGDFGDRSTLNVGGRYLIAETCEYRRHFLDFRPRRIIVTSVESEHQDYFKSYDDILDAFVSYALSLPQGGELIYCADDRGAVQTAKIAAEKRADLVLTPYGEKADGAFKIEALSTANERTRWRLASLPIEFELRVPGRHVALNASAALALVSSLIRAEFGENPWVDERIKAAASALISFHGVRRRSEIIGEAGGVLIMDDYGHHPTAIRTTLAGLKAFYPNRRLVVSFMSHTYSRTEALLDDFAASFIDADRVYLHKIYPSARESAFGRISGRTLYERALAAGAKASYIEEPMDAVSTIVRDSQKGDLFLTMGAGDNWKIGRAVFSALTKKG